MASTKHDPYAGGFFDPTHQELPTSRLVGDVIFGDKCYSRLLFFIMFYISFLTVYGSCINCKRSNDDVKRQWPSIEVRCQAWGIWKRYLLVHPTNRGCGLVHPSSKWTLPLTYPIYNQGYNPLTIRGMNQQVLLFIQLQSFDRIVSSVHDVDPRINKQHIFKSTFPMVLNMLIRVNLSTTLVQAGF